MDSLPLSPRDISLLRKLNRFGICKDWKLTIPDPNEYRLTWREDTQGVLMCREEWSSFMRRFKHPSVAPAMQEAGRLAWDLVLVRHDCSGCLYVHWRESPSTSPTPNRLEVLEYNVESRYWSFDSDPMRQGFTTK